MINRDEILYKVKQSLLNATKNRDDEYHLMTLANIDEMNNPQARKVVLRAFDMETRSINFHLDIRSPKAKQLQNNPKVCLLFFSQERKTQFKFTANCTVNYKNEVTQEKWSKTHRMSKKCYMHLNPPSSEIMYDEPDEYPDYELGYENFAVAVCKFSQLDVYELNHQIHKRYLFSWDSQNRLSFKPIAP
jgi:hypothetical protein